MKNKLFLRRAPFLCSAAVTIACVNFSIPPAFAQDDPKKVDSTAANSNRVSTATSSAPSTRRTDASSKIMDQIREEGLDRSQVMQTLSYLSDVIGPRLTGSPNLKRANNWTRDKLTSWGLTNAHLEAWGPFGTGWSLKRFSLQVVEPQTIPLAAYPKAWSPGLAQPIVADVVYLDAQDDAGLEKFKGKLKGAVVLTGGIREVRTRFDPMAARMADTNLLRLANATATESRGFRAGPADGTPVGGRGGRGAGPSSGSNSNATQNAGPGRRGGFGATNIFQTRLLGFLQKEGAALVLSPSPQGDGGTLFVAAASAPTPEGRRGNTTTNAARVWAPNPPATPPQVAVATEDYNRLVRMIQAGEKLKMAADLKVQFHSDDLMAYNTVAEIPGTDLKDEIVMVGGHMDSWHSGTGATDNGAGVAAAMEAVRILKTLDWQPRRTIRIGLWTGEEQGLLGSKAYVSNHFGYYITNSTPPASLTNQLTGASESGDSSSSTRGSARTGSATNAPSSRQLVRQFEYDKLSAYFNLDNGTGKIRGVYMQGNEAVRPLFRRWLQPFNDLGAETLTLSNTSGTDHLSFDGIGLPGFQFIQDPIDYMTRTHHSNADVFDRIQGDDLKQASVIMAAFLYQAAMLDEKLPRKSAD
jgi:hypothetical protein